MREPEHNGRDAYFDNLKGILIILVVFGHLVELFWSTGRAARWTYLAVYAFHMPLFVFCSGWFSLSQTPKKLLRNVLFPYLVWQTVYFLFYRFVLRQDALVLDYALPIWVLWYLFSCLLWGLAAPLLRPKSKRGMVLVVALAMLFGLTAGYCGQIGYRFSLSRTIVFFPFYLWGRFSRMEKADMKKAGGLPAAVLALLGLGALLVWPNFQLVWLYEAVGYAQTGGSVLIRAFHYLLAGAVSLLVLWIIPRRRTVLSGLGERSMVVFLLHGLLVRWLALQLPRLGLTRLSWWGLPLVLGGALALAALLGSRPVSVLLSPLLRFPFPQDKPRRT